MALIISLSALPKACEQESWGHIAQSSVCQRLTSTADVNWGRIPIENSELESVIQKQTTYYIMLLYMLNPYADLASVQSGGGKEFCVNGHLAGNRLCFERSSNDRSKNAVHRVDRQSVDGIKKPEGLVGEHGSLKQIAMALVERALDAEMKKRGDYLICFWWNLCVYLGNFYENGLNHASKNIYLTSGVNRLNADT